MGTAWVVHYMDAVAAERTPKQSISQDQSSEWAGSLWVVLRLN